MFGTDMDGVYKIVGYPLILVLINMVNVSAYLNLAFGFLSDIFITSGIIIGFIVFVGFILLVYIYLYL